MKRDPFRCTDQGALPEEGFWPRVPIADVAEEWTILRCASSATIDLAEELRDEQLLAWAPMIRVQTRLPRRRKTELSSGRFCRRLCSSPSMGMKRSTWRRGAGSISARGSCSTMRGVIPAVQLGRFTWRRSGAR
jgi:hypothetical protein